VNQTSAKPTLYPPGYLVHDGSGTVYRIVRELGHGGMGAVYEVVDKSLNVRFAMKMLLRADHRDRFETEARVIAQINHRNVVEVVRLGREQHTGRSFFVMRWIEGQSLQAQLKKHGRFSIMAALNIARDILSGVEELHLRGVIHCDLKPANVILSRGRDNEQTAKLIDFGIARLEAEKQREAGFTGTPAYASLEQIRNQEVTRSTDVYSVGVILYEMLVGARPFGSVQEQLRGRPESLLTFGDFPRGLDQLVARMLAPLADDRPTVGHANARVAELFLALDRGGAAPDPRVITLQSPQKPAAITRADISAPTDPDGDSVPEIVRQAREEAERQAVLDGDGPAEASTDDSGAAVDVSLEDLAHATTGAAPHRSSTLLDMLDVEPSEPVRPQSLPPPVSRETNVNAAYEPPLASAPGEPVEYLDAPPVPSDSDRPRRIASDTEPMYGPPIFLDEPDEPPGGVVPVVARPAVAPSVEAALEGGPALTPAGSRARTRRADDLGLPPAGVRLRPDQKILDRPGRISGEHLAVLLVVLLVIAVSGYFLLHGRSP
jgi:serine/threonine protein kinase